MCVFIPWIIYILGFWSPVNCRQGWQLYNVRLDCSNYGGWLLFKYIRLVTSGIPIKGVPNILVCSLHSSLFHRIGIHVPVVKYESYYVPQTKFGRQIVFAPFLLLLLIIIIIIIIISFFRQKFIRHISRRLLNGNQWIFTGMLSSMRRCADYFRNFQNGRRWYGNGQNAKKFKNTKMIIAGYSPNRNWWNLIGTTSTSSGTR
jgi:hypothetical protein